MWGWWNRKRRQKQVAAEIREERGKLAVAVIELGQKRNNVERLMRDMLDEVEETRSA